MSGSPNSGGGSPSLNRPDETFNCEDLVIITNLASPKANVINSLTIGDVLRIQTRSDQGPIEAFDRNGRIAGSIISKEQLRLLDCINKGTEFEADVLLVENAQCQIQIHAL